jgi:hypothetical protein
LQTEYGRHVSAFSMRRKTHAPNCLPSRGPHRAAGAIADPTTPAAHTFLVRLWKETRSDRRAEPLWRGTVSDLQGRQLGSFSSAAELARIVGTGLDTGVQLRISWEPQPLAAAPEA